MSKKWGPLHFVNGIPLVFIELKASHKKLELAFEKNLSDYKDTISQVFWFNAFVILSNGSKARIGSMTAGIEHFAEWKKIDNEKESGPLRRWTDTGGASSCKTLVSSRSRLVGSGRVRECLAVKGSSCAWASAAYLPRSPGRPVVPGSSLLLLKLSQPRAVRYEAGQSFVEKGWRKKGSIDEDVTLFDKEGSRILGNRLASSDQGAYVFPLTRRVRGAGLIRKWRMTAQILPVNGNSNFGVCFPELGIRYVLGAVVPDFRPSFLFMVQTYRPRVTGLTAEVAFANDWLTVFVMRFEPGGAFRRRVCRDARVSGEYRSGGRNFGAAIENCRRSVRGRCVCDGLKL